MVPPTEPNPSDASEPDALEILLAEALAILEVSGTPGVERLLQDNPKDATALRAALRDLDAIDLLQQPPGALPQQVGDFVIKGELGSGGMGVVYIAEQQSLKREVALKMVRPELLLFEGARERFRREIEAVARLDHPAIIPILATGTEHEVPFYAMPRLRGCDGERIVKKLGNRNLHELRGIDLREVIGTGEDPSSTDIVFAGGYWQAILRLIHQAALGIQHAHVRGVLHRDIKPSNIFLTQTGQAVVVDFGLARASEDPHLTRSGAAAGSPAYMAPEQVRGEPADERTDIYALAATMHCLLSLQPPFALDSREGLNTRILNGDRHPMRAQVPAEVQIVLDCAMDVDRARRYPTCQEFANDILAVLEGHSISARKLPTGVRVRRFVQRHRTVSVAFGMSVAFVFLVPALLLWQQSEASAAMREQVKKTQDEVVKKDHANLQLATTNEQLGDVNQQLETSNEALGEANTMLASSNEQLNTVNGELGRLNGLLKEQVARSDRSASLSLNAIRRLLAGTNTEKLRRNRAFLPIISRMLSDAIDLFDDLEVADQLKDDVLELKLETLVGWVDTLSAMGSYDKAIEACDKSIALTNGKDLTNKMRNFSATAMSHKASLLMDQAKHEGVRELLAASRSIFEDLIEKAVTKDHCTRQLSLIEGMVGALAMRENRMGAAETALLKAIAWTGQMPIETQPTVVHGSNQLNLVRFLKMQKRYEEAFQVAEQLLAELADVTRKDDNNWPVPRYIRAMGLNERMRILQLQNQPDEAIAAAPKLIELLGELILDYESVSELPRLRCTTYGNLGIIYLKRKQWAEAIRYSDLAVADATESLRMSPNERQALQFQATHQRVLTNALRHAQDWRRLETEALKLGSFRIPPLWRVGAARELLRCASQVPTERAADLREQAIKWLVQANQAGQRITVDKLFDSIRDDDRFKRLRTNK
ncbi:MAG: serine/threonine protein kinase [Neolewinella sp.]|jgi:serine/threonine protein kinase